MAKVAVKMELKIKGCPEIFKKEFGPGIIATQIVTWDMPEKYLKDGGSHVFFQAVNEAESEFIKDNIECVVTEVEAE